MTSIDLENRLTSWFSGRLSGCEDVRIGGIDRVEMGHSAETLLLTIGWKAEGTDHEQHVVVRVRPPAPGLLEPYDLKWQFDILRALEPTPVRSPKALWYEPSGDIFGREFYVMERLGGTVYERSVPQEIANDRERVHRMCQSMVEQIAAIHAVVPDSTGLAFAGDGRDYLQRELAHWGGEIRRVQRGPLPALEGLATALEEFRPEQYPTITMVHGDPKPGNFAFTEAEVSGVFDWEMATSGDPLADLGWAELNWTMPNSIVMVPGAPSVEELVARYEELTGFTTHRREWYRAFQGFKMAVILLVAGHLFDAGHTDDVRFCDMASVVPSLTRQALGALGVETDLADGPVLPRRGRKTGN
jgi:aminoglycoside phosphotransferase (APT) family kinase protein